VYSLYHQKLQVPQTEAEELVVCDREYVALKCAEYNYANLCLWFAGCGEQEDK
jgi:hypothetical protein